MQPVSRQQPESITPHVSRQRTIPQPSFVLQHPPVWQTPLRSGTSRRQRVHSERGCFAFCARLARGILRVHFDQWKPTTCARRAGLCGSRRPSLTALERKCSQQLDLLLRVDVIASGRTPVLGIFVVAHTGERHMSARCAQWNAYVRLVTSGSGPVHDSTPVVGYT